MELVAEGQIEMLVFCNGMPRSASTWSFNVIKGLLELCFPGEPVYSGYNDAPVEMLRSAKPEARHVVMKCHSLTPLGRTLARTRAAKVVYTIRDLSDAVASGMAAFELSFEQTLSIIEPSLALQAFHRGTGNAVILHYDEIVAQPRREIQRIGEYLAGGTMTADIVEEIAARTSFERMRQKVEEINAGAVDEDPETHLHRNHMGDGRSGKGRALLTAAQLSCIADLMREHGL